MGLLRNIRSRLYLKKITTKNIAIVFSALFIGILGIVYFKNNLLPYFLAGAAPVSYWKFDEGQGTTVNDSVGTNDGTLGTGNSAPTWANSDNCISGNCILLDGSNDYVEVGSTALIESDATDFTIEAWIKPIRVSTAQVIYGQFEENGNTSHILSLNGSVVNMDEYLPSGGGTLGNETLNANQWYFVSAVVTGGNRYLYVNGRLDKTGVAETYQGSEPTVTWLGHRFAPEGPYGFWGYMDEVKIYDYARSSVQIKSDYASRGNAKGVSAQFGDDDMSRRLSSGLISYWKMDEGTGTSITDRSGNSNTGNFGTGTSAPSWGTGKFGSAVDYGGNDYITHTQSPSIANSSFTIAGWVYADSVSADSTWFSMGNSGAVNEQLHLRMDPAGGIRFGFYGNDVDTPTSTFTTGVWHHVVYTYDISSGVRRIFFNGSKSAEDIASAPYSGNGVTYIGSFGGGEFWNGNIDEVRIYNRALDPSEVTALYQYAPGPVGQWQFDENAGGTTVDSSGNDQNGNLGSGTSTPRWATGIYGSALEFDGSNDYVTIGTDDMYNFTNDLTISAWIKPTVNAIVGGRIFERRNEGAETGFGFNVFGSRLRIFTEAESVLSNNSIITSDQWQHVAVTRSGTSITFYVNSIAQGTGTLSAIPSSSGSTARIGANSVNGTLSFLGTIDDLRLYNYARTQEQIVNDMNAGHPSIGTPVGSSVLHLKLDEGYGSTLNDNSPQNNDGTILGTSAPTWTNNGKFGKALSFDGTNDSIKLGSPTSLQLTGAHSYSVWVKTSTPGTRIIMGRRSSGDAAEDIGSEIELNSSGLVIFSTNDGATPSTTVASKTSVTDGDWHHIVATYQPSTSLKIYIDGTLESQNTSSIYSSLNSATLPVSIGSKNATDFYFSGIIDDVRIYSFALTDGQVKTVMNQGEQIVMGGGSTGIGGTLPSNAASREYCVPGDSTTCNGPIWELNMDENTGTTAYDTSTNSNNGTLGSGSSAPVWSLGHGGKGASLLFDGVNDSVITTDNSLLNIGTSDFTLSAWVKGNTMANGDVIFGKTDGGGCSASYGFHFSVFDSLYPTLHFCTSGASHAKIQGTQTLSNNQWYHINIVVDRDSSTNTKVYVNGIPVTTTVANLASHTGSISNSVNLAIGSESDGGFNWDGQIDQVKIYAYARTPAQVAWEYNHGRPSVYFNMDECTGSTIHDVTSNKINGALSLGSNGVTSTGTCSTTGAWANGSSGKYNASMSFDGSDDYVNIGDTDLLDVIDGQDFSFSFWVKTPDLSGAKALFAKKTGNGSTSVGYLVHLFSNEVLGLYISDGTDQLYVTSKQSLPINSWNQVTVVYTDNTSLKLYVNGKDVTNLNSGTITDVDSLANGSPLVIGAESDFQLPFQGQIDEVKFFKYALSSAQVKTEMADGAVNFQ